MSAYGELDRQVDAEHSQRVRELEDKLVEMKRYAQHLNYCQLLSHPLERLALKCTCGLEKILK